VPYPGRAGLPPGSQAAITTHRPAAAVTTDRPAGARSGLRPRWAWSQRAATLWRYCAAARR